jgi:hypothetical protein
MTAPLSPHPVLLPQGEGIRSHAVDADFHFVRHSMQFVIPDKRAFGERDPESRLFWIPASRE